MSQIQALDFSVDIMQSLLWQYNDALRLQSLLQQKQDWYDLNQAGFWSDWVTDVFDLRTANDFGLSVWAILLDMPLAITTPEGAFDDQRFGFEERRLNFNNGNFSPTAVANLTTEQKRLILRLRYFQLVTRGTIPEINKFFAYLFGELGSVYVVPGASPMTGLYIFNFPLSSALEVVITEFDLLPRPAGVGINYVIIGEADGFGFGRYHENFTNGNFYHA